METKRKNMIVKLLIRLTGVVLALGVVFGTFSVAETDAKAAKKTKTEQQTSKPTKKEVRALMKKIHKANNVNKLLKKHKSVFLMNEDYVLWFDKKASYTRANSINYATYIEGNLGCTLEWGNNIFAYIYLVENDCDMYDETNARYYIDYAFALKSLLEEETVSIEYDDDTIVITRLINENSTKAFLEGWGIEGVTDSLYDVLKFDAKTYEVKSTQVYVGEDRENALVTTLFYYDIDEPTECTLLRGMGDRQEGKMINCTVVRDAGTENEIRVERTIPVGSPIRIYARDLEPVRYRDAEYTEPYGEWDGLTDTVVYIRTALETEES